MRHIGLPLLAAMTLSMQAQQPARRVNSTVDAAWTRAYATPKPDTSESALPAGNRDIKWDPRFIPLMRSAFHQRQWFWFDHDHFTALPELIQIFIGVPGGVTLDDDRYVTVTGCVPHACTDVGMVWIDTGTHPATLIFAATQLVSDSVEHDGTPTHLWLFASSQQNWQHLPPDFSASLTRWLSTIAQPGYRGTNGYSFDFILATIVQPNGAMEDLTPDTFHLRSIKPGATQ